MDGSSGGCSSDLGQRAIEIAARWGGQQFRVDLVVVRLARIGPVDARREGTDSARLDRVGGSRLRLEFRRVDELLTTGQRNAGQDALIFPIQERNSDV